MKSNIDRHGQTPIYEQIYKNLLDKIRREEIIAGESFPSERELAENFGVSRMTVRQALKTLKKEGFIYHERGIGAFVSKRKLDVHTRNLVGFTEEMRGRGLRPSSRMLLFQKEAAAAAAAKDLGIEPGDEVFHFQRLRLADDSPMAFEDAFLPAAAYADLDRFDLENASLYQILENEYGVRMSHAEEVLEAMAVGKEIADALSVKKGAPVLMVHRVVFSETNAAVESVKTFYRADRYRATFYLSKNGL